MAYKPLGQSQPTGLNKPCHSMELELKLLLSSFITPYHLIRIWDQHT